MATFLLEVGTEELPASFVAEALAQWRSRIPASLTAACLTYDSFEVYGTPRRLALLIQGLPQQQPDRQEEVKGPSAQAAFDASGKATKAAEGFARSRGVQVDQFEIRQTDKGDFVFVQQNIVGRPTAHILQDLIPEWIFKLEGKRFMRWGDGDLRFPRPIRWLVSLLDDQVLPLTIVNGSESCTSDRHSQGHRVRSPEPITIRHASEYVTQLRQAHIEVDPAQRETLIQSQAQAAAQTVKGYAAITPSLLKEVCDLVESPNAVVGQFDPEFLSLPTEVIVTEMESHQRYFPILKAQNSSELLPYFITISNGDPAKAATIAAGNGRVIRARLSDGKYFFDLDLKQPLEAYLPRLETVTFQQDLGSVRDKVDRIIGIVRQIADQLSIPAAQRTLIERAALLCKTDLVTQMVGEFPELQGVMGEKYARSGGEAEEVATAIFEHYLPRGAGDRLPTTLAGQVVGIADRMDTLVGIFSLGMTPTGSSDPFALRRAANAIVNIIWHANLPINLQKLLDQVISTFVVDRMNKVQAQVEDQVQDQDKIQAPGKGKAKPLGKKKDKQKVKDKPNPATDLKQQLQEFFIQRLRSLLQDEHGIEYDLVNAVLGESDRAYTERCLQDLLDGRDRAQFLQLSRNNGELDRIYATVNRASRLAAQADLNQTELSPESLSPESLSPESIVKPSLFQQPTEQAFYDALVQLVPQTQAAQADRDYQKLVEGLAEIAPVVSQFFDGEQSVLVMDENLEVRKNRLYLLGLLRNHARVLADFGAIVKG